MTSRDFRERLSRRARKAHLPLRADVIEPLEAYFRLLVQWNVKINLTALPLQPPTDATFDRLFVEPLAAASLVDDGAETWFDLGSGGGSPGLPLKMMRARLALTLVESKTRKAAFLREAVRALRLPKTEVANIRFEELDPALDRTADLVTVRAVRRDTALMGVASRLLKGGGRLLLFGPPADLSHSDFKSTSPSISSESAPLVTSYTRMFHVEQS